MNQSEYNKAHRPQINATRRLLRHSNIEKTRAEARAQYAKDLNHSRVLSAARKAKRVEQANRVSAAYKQANHHRVLAWNSNRRAMQLNQRCNCCSNDAISEIFSTAALVDGEVDHTTPLRLGGHHCCKNLQPMTSEAHKIKTREDMRRIADSRLRNRLVKAWRTF